MTPRASSRCEVSIRPGNERRSWEELDRIERSACGHLLWVPRGTYKIEATRGLGALRKDTPVCERKLGSLAVGVPGFLTLQQQIDKKVDFETFFVRAPRINQNVSKITGVICGYRVEEIEDCSS